MHTLPEPTTTAAAAAAATMPTATGFTHRVPLAPGGVVVGAFLPADLQD